MKQYKKLKWLILGFPLGYCIGTAIKHNDPTLTGVLLILLVLISGESIIDND